VTKNKVGFTPDEFEKELLREKQELFKSFALQTAKKLKLSRPAIKIWEGRCPEDIGNELAHIHLDMRPPLICISNRRLKSMSLDEIKETAAHEVSHMRCPDHDGILYVMISDILEGDWKPPSGMPVIDGTAKTSMQKPSKTKKVTDECNYHLCHGKKGLKPCPLCERVFCRQHLEPKLAAAGSSDLRTPEQWIADLSRVAEGGHPCTKYSEDYESGEEKEARHKIREPSQKQRAKEKKDAEEEYHEAADSEEAKARVAKLAEIERQKILKYEQRLEAERKREGHEPPAVRPQHTREWVSTTKEKTKSKTLWQKIKCLFERQK